MKTLYYFFIETPLLLIQYIVLWFIEPRPLNLSKLEDIMVLIMQITQTFVMHSFAMLPTKVRS